MLLRDYAKTMHRALNLTREPDALNASFDHESIIEPGNMSEASVQASNQEKKATYLLSDRVQAYLSISRLIPDPT